MLEKTPYTPAMRDVFKLARQEAGRLGHDYVGPEHYLLGVIRKGNGAAVQALLSLEVDLTVLKKTVEQMLQMGDTPRVGLFSSNEEARRVLDLSKEVARELEQKWVSTEHLLLAIIWAKNTIPGKALEKLGVGFDGVREEVLNIQQGETGEFQRALWLSSEEGPPFSAGLRLALKLANKEANLLGNDHIRPEHLLLGIIRKDNGIAWQSLYSMKVDLKDLRLRLLRKLDTGTPKGGTRAPDAKAQTAVIRAGQLAGSQQARFTGTHHLLLALLEDKNGLPAQTLLEMKTEADTIPSTIEAVLEVFDSEFGTELLRRVLR